MKLRDNFLPEDELLKLQQVMMSNTFPWYYNSFKVNNDAYEQSRLDYYQFTHIFYKDGKEMSYLIKLLQPIFDKLNVKTLVKVKANCNPYTPEKLSFPFHTDVKKPEGITTNIFFLNTTNAETFLKTGEKAVGIGESVVNKENRMLSFPATIEHSGSTCTDAKARFLININYV